MAVPPSVRSWFAGIAGSVDRAGFTLISPDGATPSTKSPFHLNGMPTPRADSPVRTGGSDRTGPRPRWATLAVMAGVALVAVWLDRSLVRKVQEYSLREWMSRRIDPSMGSQRSDVASLRGVCDQSTVAVGKAPKEVGTIDVGMDRLMSQAQCDAVFPALYKELDRSVRHVQKRGLIKRRQLDEMIDRGHARVLIHNNRMFMKQFNGGPGSRTEATLNSIQEAVVTSPEALPNVEFVIKTLDAPNDDDDGFPLWVLDRKAHQEAFWLMPDYGFYSWPEPGVGGIVEVRDKCGWWEGKQSWKDKIPKLFWRGALLNELREDFAEIAKGHKWNAVGGITWGDLKGMLKTPEEHCAYKFLAHAEGHAYSGRLKYLQMCRSVIVAHEMEYIQHFHHLIDGAPGSPTQNMAIAPGPGFEGLPVLMQELIEDDYRAERIANNSYELFRHYLSPASVSCYWRQMIRSWAQVQHYKPVRRADDTSFESFNLMREVHWDPH